MKEDVTNIFFGANEKKWTAIWLIISTIPLKVYECNSLKILQDMGDNAVMVPHCLKKYYTLNPEFVFFLPFEVGTTCKIYV